MSLKNFWMAKPGRRTGTRAVLVTKFPFDMHATSNTRSWLWCRPMPPSRSSS